MAIPNQILLLQDPVFGNRIEMMERHVPLSTARVLEIGAFDRPTFTPDPIFARFLDYRSTEELIRLAHLEVGRDVKAIPPVDYVATSNRLSAEVDRIFDGVVGNHVVEHVPNLLDWLIEVRKILQADGFLFLSVPDRRYTFDYLRFETGVVEVLRRYADAVTRPSFWDVLDARYRERPSLVNDEAWYPEILAQRLIESARPLSLAFEMALVEARLPYCDIHCSVFTADSFAQLFRDLTEIRCNPFQIVEIGQVAPGTLEFHVLLRANPEFDQAAMPVFPLRKMGVLTCP